MQVITNLPDVSGLRFMQSPHRYLLTQGTATLQLPSVTQIIRFISKEFYGQIDPVTLHKAADRGTRVHETIELIDQGAWAPIDPDIVGYIQAYEAWKELYQPQIIAAEWRGYHRTMLYAGTVDQLVMLPGQDSLVLVDIKTSSTYYPLLVDVQLAGYALMMESWPGVKIEGTWGLQLKADGTYNFHRTQDLSRAKSYFTMCYALHGAVQLQKEV
jgi:hypothetical protein